ncbi:MAG TPA: hypothetical protein VLG92_03480 [Candidatus Saccharimonadia bacterium]|nr:hypothetical protein [Candidatus Saccharimonadia bacterium]
MKTRNKPPRILTAISVISYLILLSPSSIATASSAISQSYQTDSGNITQGTLVSLTTSKSSLVTPASSSSAAALIGVATSKPLIELSNSGQGSVQVAVGGTVDAFVSDINGPVKAGDKVTASPISGIGMKATTASEIVGTAQANLSSTKTVTKTFTTTNGQKASVHVGLLPITVTVSYYSAAAPEASIASILPPFLQSIANTLTGKQVSPLRVLLGTCALLLGFIAATIMLYVAIRSQMISIGRNPLAESAIRKGLVDAIVAAIGVLLITIGVVYGVLFS